MAKKVTKILFWLSFLPFFGLVAFSGYYAIAGYDIYTMILPEYVRTVYGWEAFQEVFVWYGLGLCVIPVLPAMALYQLIYGIIWAVRRHRAKKSASGED